jgi:excisionase family DNA binding protein
MNARAALHVRAVRRGAVRPVATGSSVSEYITITQAASALSVSTKTVRRMIDRGDLPAKRIGTRMVRIPSHVLDGIGYAIPASRRA